MNTDDNDDSYQHNNCWDDTDYGYYDHSPYGVDSTGSNNNKQDEFEFEDAANDDFMMTADDQLVSTPTITIPPPSKKASKLETGIEHTVILLHSKLSST
jgi:hypothetical protein